MPVDWKVFHNNLATFPLEKLEPHLGEWVAYNFTATEIVAHSAISPEDVYDQLRQRGENPGEYLVEYLEGPGDVFAGPFIISRGKEAPPTSATAGGHEQTKG